MLRTIDVTLAQKQPVEVDGKLRCFLSLAAPYMCARNASVSVSSNSNPRFPRESFSPSSHVRDLFVCRDRDLDLDLTGFNTS